ncbi:DUF4126 family protein [Hymenobacter sp. 5516J-16]|uniref:DUF4126 family protein n=1 Tax=Hymenobacter sublimis TaxID=2933777 RepID=A0ABY4J9A3_9BACT|nr:MULTISPECIES: DUF4126 family protein [Hymenobacter]UOQ78003.1 DUF4126 family protein [Hymenobacter sp. 5516J-16]UPL47984.1 DUF4126 family protein [Hymenobacter sublimis]
MSKHLWQTVGLGAIAGFRSMTAPALLSSNLLQYHPQALAGSPLRWLQKPLVAHGLKVLAAGEMTADKLPQMPDRIAPMVLLGRAAAGALVGATLYKINHDKPLSGALVGSVAAVAASYLSFVLRKKATEGSGLPGGLIGGLEDLFTLGTGLALTKGTHVGQPEPRHWVL